MWIRELTTTVPRLTLAASRHLHRHHGRTAGARLPETDHGPGGRARTHQQGLALPQVVEPDGPNLGQQRVLRRPVAEQLGGEHHPVEVQARVDRAVLGARGDVGRAVRLARDEMRQQAHRPRQSSSRVVDGV